MDDLLSFTANEKTMGVLNKWEFTAPVPTTKDQTEEEKSAAEEEKQAVPTPEEAEPNFFWRKPQLPRKTKTMAVEAIEESCIFAFVLKVRRVFHRLHGKA